MVGILIDPPDTDLPPVIAKIYVIMFLPVLGLYADRLTE